MSKVLRLCLFRDRAGEKLIKRILFFTFVFLFSVSTKAFCLDDSLVINKGIWVSVFSGEKVIFSPNGVTKLINFAQKNGINEIYLQIYQSGKSFYDTRLNDRTKYNEMLKSCGADPIDALLKQASAKNIKVFAWINVLGIGENKNADIVKKFGDSVLTRDQYLNTSGGPNNKELDKYYIRDRHFFLEPGDPRVGKYILSVIDEIMDRYPSLSGFHLDYMRYPMTVPFISSSKFRKFGLDYGFGQNNIVRFKEKNGIDPLRGLEKEQKFELWDNWKRQQITDLVQDISRYIKKRYSKMLVSCAVIASPERAYSSLYQDWPLWLEKSFLDYVVLMNYSKDSRLVKEVSKSAIALRGKGKVYVGLGAFLFKDDSSGFLEQYKITAATEPDGIVFFSYDELAGLNVTLP